MVAAHPYGIPYSRNNQNEWMTQMPFVKNVLVVFFNPPAIACYWFKISLNQLKHVAAEDAHQETPHGRMACGRAPRMGKTNSPEVQGCLLERERESSWYREGMIYIDLWFVAEFGIVID